MTEPEARPPWKITPQVAAMIALTLLALVVPLAGVAFLVNAYFGSARRVGPVGAVTQSGRWDEAGSLRASLERAASRNLAPPPAAIEHPVIELSARDAEEARRITATMRDFAARAGVDILPPEPAGGAQRFVTALPANWVGELRRALLGAGFSLPPPSAEASMVEVWVHPAGAK